MFDPACLREAENRRRTEGVVEAEVRFERAEAVVKYDDRKVTALRLREAINATGFKAEVVVPEKPPGAGGRKGSRRG